jgi:hypothetical protein
MWNELESKAEFRQKNPSRSGFEAVERSTAIVEVFCTFIGKCFVLDRAGFRLV